MKFFNNDNTFTCDVDDWNKYKNHCWYQNESGYAMARINGTLVRFHRLVINASKSEEVDHINRDRTNNCKLNLRICKHCENMKNLQIRKDNTSGSRGVVYEKRSGKWLAVIVCDGVSYYLGKYSNISDAISARNNAELKLFKEFSHLYKGIQYE